MIRISQIKMPVTADRQDLEQKISKILRGKKFTLKRIVKKSIDARNKDNLMYIYSVDVKSPEENAILRQNRNNNNIMSTKEQKYCFPTCDSKSANYAPIIVGAGPAGYFCGLYLARQGYRPVILERGKCVDERTKDVQDFWERGIINPESNVSFGEGGAGTFSDGKLNTGIGDKEGRIHAVIDDFISFGAPEEISYLGMPHIGTDELRNVLKNMRNEILSLGGKIHFNSRFTDFRQAENGTISVHVMQQDKEISLITNALILALGHSARDTFAMLHDKNLPMEPKSFAMGVRIEHPREMIQVSQYGSSKEAELLPAASYKMTYRSSTGRSVYSFCMCPGGFVVNASTEDGQAVVNGMSNHARNEENSNSAIVVNVTPEDFFAEGFEEYGVLAGVEFQKKYETLAFQEGQGGIPVQLFGDYRKNQSSNGFGEIHPNIRGKYRFGNLNNCLPAYVNNAIIEGVIDYDKKLAGFGRGDAVLSGIESRTSSPVRILRDENFMSKIKGIFPCGEGAGYAGGITSAAVDGIKTAEAVAKYLDGETTKNE